MTDKDGKTITKYKYDAWGNSTYKWGTTGTGSEIVDLNPYRYSGYWYDSEIDKYYLKARYYDSDIGRFLAKDPIAVRIGESLSLNAYTYAGNNPVMYIDPSGEILAAWLVPIVAGALIGMAIDGGLYLWSVRDGGFTLGGFSIKVIEGALSGAIFYGGLGKYFLESGIFIKSSSIVKGAFKAVSNKWYKSTFNTVEDSMEYHLKTHGKGRTIEQYTDDAMNFYNKNKNLGVEVALMDGTKGIKIQTKFGKNKVGGYWTKDGKLVTFWD